MCNLYFRTNIMNTKVTLSDHLAFTTKPLHRFQCYLAWRYFDSWSIYRNNRHIRRRSWFQLLLLRGIFCDEYKGLFISEVYTFLYLLSWLFIYSKHSIAKKNILRLIFVKKISEIQKGRFGSMIIVAHE